MNRKSVLAVFGLLLAGSVWADPPPHIGYAYPSGGQRGTSFEVEIGGQFLQADPILYIGNKNLQKGHKMKCPDFEPAIYVSGRGVQVEVTDHFREFAKNDRNRARNRLQVITQVYEKSSPEDQALMDLEKEVVKQAYREQEADKKRIRLLYKSSLRKQFNPQLAERLTVKVTISPDAPAGERELRVKTKFGLSNPIYFHVGALPEILEKEPNDDHQTSSLPTASLPVLINGQVFPGDIDHFSFKAEKGQKLVFNVYARKLIPYLADAVPGWFQATLGLYDETGNEIAFIDDYKFNPDPVMFFDVPEDGVYTVKISDAIYRGREDFVYRIEIGELPFITSAFPLGGRKGSSVDIALTGRNLPKKTLKGVMPKNSPPIRQVTVGKEPNRSNPVMFAVGNLPEIMEPKADDGSMKPFPARTPVIINGRIQQPGDWDVYAFSGAKGKRVVVEVQARNLGSMLDSKIRLTTESGELLAENDDFVKKEGHLHKDSSGLMTHHADSYLLFELPETGTYHVQIGDAQAKGSPEHAYRLRVSQAKPDFFLRMDPSGVNIAPGGTAAFTLHVTRIDGFKGPIKLKMEDLPDGFRMSSSVIPANAEKLRFTLTAPKELPEQMVRPKIIGTAELGSRNLSRTAVPSDNSMQAFLYRHLVPAQELVLVPSDPVPFSFSVKTLPQGIKLPIGKEVYVPVSVTRHPEVELGSKNLKFDLDNPPEGIVLVKGGLVLSSKSRRGGFVLKADDTLKVGTKATLIVNAVSRKGKNETYYPLPAIPVQVVDASVKVESKAPTVKAPKKKSAKKKLK